MTALGSARKDGVAGAAAAVVQYLDGRGHGTRGEQPGRNPGQLPVLPGPEPGVDCAVGYYADSVEGPGRWVGRGVGGVQVRGVVASEGLRRALLGEDPRTGRRVVARAPEPVSPPPEAMGADGWMSVAEAATAAGVGVGYVRRLARQSEQAAARWVVELMAGAPVTRAPRRLLTVERTRGDKPVWRIRRRSVERLAALRRERAIVIGYDVTFSAPKSVSLLWASGDAAVRRQVIASVDAAVDAGVRYLEDNAAFVRVKGRRVPVTGLLAASYLHGTSRALDPQLHRHVVVANVAAAEGGDARALDGSPLWAHAKTAGYLAAAELRHQLTKRLGIAWQPVVRGLADVAGVPRVAIDALSRRKADIDRAAATAGVSSASGRQTAAYDTRASKGEGVDPAALLQWWRDRLAEVGFGPEQAAACLGRTTIRTLAPDDVVALFRALASSSGLTEQSATFDRRDVIQHVAEWAGERLTADAVCQLADRWLSTGQAVPLDPRRGGGLREGWRPGGVLLSTPDMLDAEEWVLNAFLEGANGGAGLVPSAVVEGVLAEHASLGTDQAAVVRAITTSGDQVQCVVGPAGTGKTFALERAARAWEAAGYRVLGAAVGGTAAEVLGRSTAVPAATVASLLTRIETATEPVLDARTVVVVDEASTLGTRDLACLLRHTRQAGAALRLIGDPAQHSSVAAGGCFRLLVERHPDRTPALQTLRRQRGAAMGEVRLALTEYRDGKIAEAVARLDRDDRIVVADTADALLDALVADWYVDRLTAAPAATPSSMVAEHHTERRELNRRARLLLALDGTLTGPALTASGSEFRAGDEVIARAQDRSLRPRGGDRDSYVRNGTRGTVVRVRPGQTGLHVDFQSRGVVVVPIQFLEREIRPGIRGGLVHSYCLTSHAAQGETYEAARHLGTDRSTRAGVYVGLSRGRTEARLYTIRHRALDPDEDDGLPRLPDRTPAVDAVTGRLDRRGPERLALEHQPVAAAAASLATTVPLAALMEAEESDGAAAAAARMVANRIAAATRLAPPPDLLERLGPRPDGGAARRAWDRAVGLAVVFEARWGQSPFTQPSPGSTDPSGPDRSRVRLAARAAQVSGLAALPTRDLAGRARATADPFERGLFEEALGQQIQLAVQHPAPYLLAVLGEPAGAGRDRWDDHARRVERWRHRTLGCCPEDGPVAGEGDLLLAAIGMRPAERSLAVQWERLRRELVPTIEPPAPRVTL